MGGQVWVGRCGWELMGAGAGLRCLDRGRLGGGLVDRQLHRRRCRRHHHAINKTHHNSPLTSLLPTHTPLWQPPDAVVKLPKLKILRLERNRLEKITGIAKCTVSVEWC